MRVGKLDRLYAVLTAAAPMAVSLAQVPVLTHTLSPREFGLWATILAVVSFLQQADLGVGYSMFRFMVFGYQKSGDAGVWPYLRFALRFYPALTVVFVGAAWPWRDVLLRRLGHENALPIVILFLSLCILYPLNNAVLRAFQAAGEFRRAASVVVATQMAYLVTILCCLVFTSMSIVVPLAAQLAQTFIVTTIGIARFGRKLPEADPSIAIRDFLRFSRRVFLVNLSGAAVLQLPIVILGGAVNGHMLGVYALMSMIVTALRNLPLMSLPPLIRQMHGDYHQIVTESRSVIRAWGKSLIVWAPVGVAAIAIGIPVLGGKGYAVGVLPGMLLFAGHYVSLWGAALTATAQQLLLNRTEALASVAAAAIDIGLLLGLRTQLGLFAPGIALVSSQVLCLALYVAQYRGILRKDVQMRASRMGSPC